MTDSQSIDTRQKKQRGLPPKTLPLGAVFGRLTILAVGEMRLRRDGRRQSQSVCRCMCGKQIVVANSRLKNGDTKSCGCLQAEVLLAANTKHGNAARGKQSGAWSSWTAMIARVRNPKHKAYKYYGGRGITVCGRWLKFENFLADMGDRPSPVHSIDRFPDKTGNYEPGNCRWATHTEQMNNTSRSRYLTIGDETLTLPQWSRRSGVNTQTIAYRLKSGMPPRDAVWNPPLCTGIRRRHSIH